HPASTAARQRDFGCCGQGSSRCLLQTGILRQDHPHGAHHEAAGCDTGSIQQGTACSTEGRERTCCRQAVLPESTLHHHHRTGTAARIPFGGRKDKDLALHLLRSTDSGISKTGRGWKESSFQPLFYF